MCTWSQVPMHVPTHVSLPALSWSSMVQNEKARDGSEEGVKGKMWMSGLVCRAGSEQLVVWMAGRRGEGPGSDYASLSRMLKRGGGPFPRDSVQSCLRVPESRCPHTPSPPTAAPAPTETKPVHPSSGLFPWISFWSQSSRVKGFLL